MGSASARSFPLEENDEVYCQGRITEMKKILSLALALALVLGAVSALASESTATQAVAPSKTNQDIQQSEVKETVTEASAADTTNTGAANAAANTVATTPEPITSTVVADSETTDALKEEFAKAVEAGDVSAVLPENLQSAVADFTKVNEIVTVRLSGDVSEVTYVTVNYKLETPYAEGEKVMVAYAVTVNGQIQWILVEGTAQKDGSINVTLNAEALAMLVNRDATLIVLSK